MRLYLMLGSLLLAATTNAAERSVERSLDVNPDVHLELTSNRGSVEIVTGASARMQIFVRIEHEDEEVLERVSVDIDASASHVEISTDYGREGFSFNFFGFHDYGNDYVSPRVHYRIVLPEQASLKLTAHRARLDVQAPGGHVDISGHRSSGRIAGVRNDLTISTRRGDFDVQVQELHDLNLSAHRGNYRLDIAAADDFALKGDTYRGRVDISGKDIRQDRRRRQVRVDHSEGGGTHLFTFDTHRGNISIDFGD